MAKANKTQPAAVQPGATAQANEASQATEQTKPTPVPKDERNGIVRPAGGVTRRVWEIADELSSKNQKPAERKEVTEVAEKEGINVGTIHTQFGRWRKYYGLVTPKEERAAQMAAAKAQREADKVAAKQAKEAEKAAKQAEKEAKAKVKAEAAAAKQAEAQAQAAQQPSEPAA